MRKHPGTHLGPSADRFGVTSWDEWFPAHGLVSDGFFSLTAARPADVTRALGWSPAAFLDTSSVAMGNGDVELSAHYAGGGLRLVEMAKLRGSTPHWLRGPLHPDAVRELDHQILDGTLKLSVRGVSCAFT